MASSAAYASPDVAQHWYLADKDEVHGPVFAFVNRTEIEQSDVYDRLLSLESLYDKHSPDDGSANEPRAAMFLSRFANMDTMDTGTRAICPCPRKHGI